MAAGEFYRVTLVFSDATTSGVITSAFHVEQDSSAGFDVGDIEGAVVAWWNTELNSSGLTAGQKQIHDSTTALTSVKLRKIDPLEPVETEDTTGLPISGTSGGDPMPSNNCVLISLRTAQIGRRYRNRMYLPAPGEAEVEPDFTLAEAENIAQQFVGLVGELQSIGAGGLSIARVSAYSAALGTGNDVTNVKVDRILRTQRRRAFHPAIYATVPT